ncbi:hypothetical protein ECE128010_5279 [Escherichia coli E128010]|nr:hypothetical protein ECE128010_5279 [Escherichia coli E128010]
MQLFKLPGQQVYFLEVTTCFILFFSELDEARIDGLRARCTGGVSSHWSRFFHA